MNPDPMTGEVVLRARPHVIGGGVGEGNTPTMIQVREVRPGTRYRYRLELREVDHYENTWGWDEAVRLVKAWNAARITSPTGRWNGYHYSLTTKNLDQWQVKRG